jgi:hypothetical protein
MPNLLKDFSKVPSLNVRIRKEVDEYVASLENACDFDLTCSIPESSGETPEAAKEKFRSTVEQLKARRLLPNPLYYTFIQHRAGIPLMPEECISPDKSRSL